jgi:hypothetical protein
VFLGTLDTWPSALVDEPVRWPERRTRILSIPVTVDYLRPYVASPNITVRMMMDCGVVWSCGKDGALLIVAPWWNANS